MVTKSRQKMEELNKIDDFIYKTLNDLLFDAVPEFKTVFELDSSNYNFSGGLYLLMNEFASFLAKEIEIEPAGAVVSKAFTFINQLGESNNLEVLNILKVGILEIIYTEKNIDREMIAGCLSEKLQKYFYEFSHYYN